MHGENKNVTVTGKVLGVEKFAFGTKKGERITIANADAVIRRNAASWLFSKKKRKWTYAWMLGQLSDEPHDLRAKIARGLKAMRERIPEVREARWAGTSAAPADVVRSPNESTNTHAHGAARLPQSGDDAPPEESGGRLPD